MNFETKQQLLEYVKTKYCNYYIQDMTTNDTFPLDNYILVNSYIYNPLNKVLIWIKK